MAKKKRSQRDEQHALLAEMLFLSLEQIRQLHRYAHDHGRMDVAAGLCLAVQGSVTGEPTEIIAGLQDTVLRLLVPIEDQGAFKLRIVHGGHPLATPPSEESIRQAQDKATRLMRDNPEIYGTLVPDAEERQRLIDVAQDYLDRNWAGNQASEKMRRLRRLLDDEG